MTTANDRTVPVTVLLPVHNGFPHLAAAVTSILDQTHQDLELLVVDDGSTDGSGDWLEGLTDPRVRVLHQANRGLVAALNRGLAEARHDIVARMDADDVSRARRLELQVEHLAAHRHVVAVGCCYDVVDEHSKRLETVHTAASADYLRRQLYFRNVLPHAGMTFRRTDVLAAGGYRDVGPAEDYDLWTRLVEHHAIDSLPEVLLDYRVTSTGISVQAAGRQRRALREVRGRLHDARPIPAIAARDVMEEGLAHGVRYGESCPTAGRSYVFDHAWLAVLLVRRGRLLAALRIVDGLCRLVARRPTDAKGLADVLRRR